MAGQSFLSLGGGVSLQLEESEVVNSLVDMFNLRLDDHLGVSHLAVDLPVCLVTLITNSWAMAVIYR
jgi:hypothetical protein